MQKYYSKINCSKQNYFSFAVYKCRSFYSLLDKNKNSVINVKCSLLSLNEYKNYYSHINFFCEKLKNTWNKKNFSTKNKDYNVDRLEHCINSKNKKVYVKNHIYDVIHYLCKNKEVEDISTNLIFFLLKFLDTKNVATSEEYKDNIKRIYSDLIKCYHRIFKNVNENGEFIFCIFNDDIIKSTSPSLKRSKKIVIRKIILDTLEFYFKNNVSKKNRLNINLMCEIIKYKNFFYVLDFINYDKNQLKEKMNIKNIDYLFNEFLTDKIYFSKAIELASLFYSEDTNIMKPFKEHSIFNCFILLKNILKIQSKNFLFLFLNSLKYNNLKQEAFQFLLSVDPLTGFMSNYWGYLAAKEFILLENSGIKEKDAKKKKEINDDSFKKENQEEERNNINKEYYELPDEMKNILFLNTIDEFKRLMVSIKKEQEKYWEESIYNLEDIYNLELDDNSIITIQNINDNLKKKKKRYYVAIDLEWYKNQKVSIISISTNKQIYIVDLLNIDYNFKLLICYFFKWLLENPFIYKLFYNFSCDMQKLSSFFHNISPLNLFTNVIDLKDPLEIIIKEDKNITCGNNVFNFELFNKHLIENNDIELFKSVTKSNKYDFNNKIKKNFNKFENTILSHNKVSKLHFRSLNDLSQKFLKKKLNKQLQLSNWNKRPLTKDQIIYASIDSYNLIKIEETLSEHNYSSTCSSNSFHLINMFVRKYKLKDCLWE